MSVLVALRGELAHADRALRSVSPAHQRRVAPGDYDVLSVGAEQPFDRAFFASTAPIVGFLDGAPISTPRLVEHVLAAARLFPRPIIAVPSYVLGREEGSGLDDAEYEAILSGVDWQNDAYGLFEVSRFARENQHGYLSSLLESSTFFCTRDMCKTLFASRTAGLVRADDLFVELLRNGANRLVVLGGEGAFRPARTAGSTPRDLWLRAERQPTLYGAIPGQSHEFFAASIGYSAMHEAIAREAGSDEWRFDPRNPVTAAAPERAAPRAPKLSIAIVAFDMPRQLENTLHSLSARHQWNVSEDDYEILVVENRSRNVLGEERAVRAGRNVRYFLREETGVSPAPALNFAVSQARGELVGLLIDGARMATPRVVEHALLAGAAHPRPIAVVPGFHLGPGRQHLTSSQGYDEPVEMKLLEAADWKRSGYRLFDVACFDEATNNGFLNPLLEATYLFTAKACFDEVGGLDERFDLEGGGDVNLDLFERLCRLPDTRYLVLWGEGNFHQYHRGVSTTTGDREAKLERFRNQYDALRGRRYRTFEREPWLLGTSCGTAHARFAEAVSLGRLRYLMRRDEGRKEWENE